MRAQQTFLHSENGIFRHYYLCTYRPLQARPDLISRSVLRFKQGLQPHLDYWTNAAVNALRSLAFPPAVTMIRALSHQETMATENTALSLNHLAKALAQNLDIPYEPTLLWKSFATPPNKEHSRSERLQHLKAAYHAAATTSDNFLIIDDILTTGATANAIIGALRQSNPTCQINIFTLAKASRY